VKKSKNQLRREKAKAQKQGAVIQSVSNVSERSNQVNSTSSQLQDDNFNGRGYNVDIITPKDAVASDEVIEDEPNLMDLLDDPMYSQYKAVFDKFYTPEATKKEINADLNKGDVFYSDDEDGVAGVYDQNDDESDVEGNADRLGSENLSRRKFRKLNKMKIVDLKTMAARPEVVDWYDVDAEDPLLFVHLKGYKNNVPVPAHWSAKHDYLSSKRGIEKPPFDLPDFIKATGIMDVRDNSKEDESTLRQRTRERVQPKMGRLDIDYQKLHDAFFKFQTKPRLFSYGEVYFEGKENEKNTFHFRPGEISQRLTEALNIPPGAPPPWLLNMQRFGPPPSYQGLRIPGLNAPIPAGSSWGFQPGGYGRPPLDENNVPLYGDVFGLTEQDETDDLSLAVPVQRGPWGEMISDSEEEEEEEEEEEDVDNEEGVGYVDEETAAIQEQQEDSHKDIGGSDRLWFREEDGVRAEAVDEISVIPETFELRKTQPVAQPDDLSQPKSLYTVLEQKEKAMTGFMDSYYSYDVPGKSRRPEV
ncbi:DUF382-domain-containing protein, partial [Nadsonia fulvescens var. elongata DSM 6958]